jgi:hypothetical protein
MPTNPATRHDSRCRCAACKASECTHTEPAVEYESGYIECLGCGADLRTLAYLPQPQRELPDAD